MFAWLGIWHRRTVAKAHGCCAERQRPAPPPRDPARRIVRVRITDGCTVCGACEVTCPEVFTVLDDGAVLVATASEHFEAKRLEIEEAVDGCPMEVLRIHYDDGTTLPQ